MTTYLPLTYHLPTTPLHIPTTYTTYTYIIDNNNKRVGGDDRVGIYRKSSKWSVISIKAVTKLIVSRRKAVITTLHRLSWVRFSDFVMRKTWGIRTLNGLNSLSGNICLFYAFYYIKYINRYTNVNTCKYLFF